MAKLHKSKRAIFPKLEQRKFLIQAKESFGISWIDIAKLLHVNNRTLTDWKREKFSMPLFAVKIIVKKLKINMPQNIDVVDPFWYASRGASIGGSAAYKKYGRVGGDSLYRKKKWKEWWDNKGKYQNHPVIGVTKPIKIPTFSNELAEFVGIMLGDGGISKSQVTITLNALDDADYCNFVAKIIKSLFGVEPKIYEKRGYKANNVVVSRKELVKFCFESLGLKIGNKVKQQIDIPCWVMKDERFKISCLRGLIDTDGSVFVHKYKVKGRMYSYKKISFASLSQPLRLSVYAIMKEIGLNPRLAKHKDVRLDSQSDVKKYFQVVSSHNKKHLKRYSN